MHARSYTYFGIMVEGSRYDGGDLRLFVVLRQKLRRRTKKLLKISQVTGMKMKQVTGMKMKPNSFLKLSRRSEKLLKV